MTGSIQPRYFITLIIFTHASDRRIGSTVICAVLGKVMEIQWIAIETSIGGTMTIAMAAAMTTGILLIVVVVSILMLMLILMKWK